MNEELEPSIEDFSEIDLDLDERAPNLGYALVCSLFAFLFSIGSCYFALFSISFNKGLANIPESYLYTASKCTPLIPTKYLVPNSYIFPVTNEDTADNFRYTSYIYLFESEFRNRAIQKEIFDYSQYLIFSTSHYISKLKQVYDVSDIDIDQSVGEFSSIGEPSSLLVNTSNYSDAFLPKSLILSIADLGSKNQQPEGINETSDTLNSDNQTKYKRKTQKSMQRKPLSSEQINAKKQIFSFSITESSVIRGTEGIKTSLAVQGRPVAYSFRMPVRQIRALCTEKGNCRKCNDSDKNCEFYNVSDNELHFGIGGEFVPGDPTALVIVGYNDNIIIEKENGNFTKGGFIMRGRKKGIGHSYQYYTDQITARQESELCYSPSKPIPGNIECLLSLNGKAPTMCNDATPLTCVDEQFCNLTDTYALASSSVDESLYVNVDKNITVDFSFIPQTLREQVLMPPKASNLTYCGYFFLPYSVIDEMEQNACSRYANEAIYLSISYNNIQQDAIYEEDIRTFKNITVNLLNSLEL